jgi:hypothetical protein
MNLFYSATIGPVDHPSKVIVKILNYSSANGFFTYQDLKGNFLEVETEKLHPVWLEPKYREEKTT